MVSGGKQSTRWSMLRVGVFAACAVAVLAGVVIFLTKSEAIFESKAILYTDFANVSGLVVGSPVRLAGIDIGSVESIRFSKDQTNKRVVVGLGVKEVYLSRIHHDSIAQLNSRGLLGDMMVNISLGSPDQPELEDGGNLQSREVQGIAELINSVEGVVARVNGLTGVIDERLRQILTEDLANDLGRMVKSTANMMEQVERGPGLAHALLYDRELKDSAAGVLSDARKTASRVDSTMARIDRAMTEVERGDGLLHGAIYGEGGAALFKELTSASAELKDILHEVREGKGIAHTMIYEEDRTNLLVNLEHASQIVDRLMTEVDEGKGTIGGLLKDPTVYRDLKGVLNSVRRNVLLKALVRMTIKEDHLEAPPMPESPSEDREERASR